MHYVEGGDQRQTVQCYLRHKTVKPGMLNKKCWHTHLVNAKLWSTVLLPPTLSIAIDLHLEDQVQDALFTFTPRHHRQNR